MENNLLNTGTNDDNSELNEDISREIRAKTVVGDRKEAIDMQNSFKDKKTRKKSVHFPDNCVVCIDDSSENSDTGQFAKRRTSIS